MLLARCLHAVDLFGYAGVGCLHAVDLFGYAGDGRRLEQRGEREFDTEGLLNFQHDRDSRQGIAAQVIQIVMNADLLGLQDVRPTFDQGGFGIGSWRNLDRLEVGPRLVGLRKSLAIDLFVGRQRQGL